MVEDSKPKSLTDDIKKLFDLLKEGASYLLHFYLYFFSKTLPVEFIENLFDHHKKNSSYDYSKDGKTYLYRLFNCIFEVEKQAVAWGLQYIYGYIPLPFFKKIYENFCVNNNLECTDVKLKKCKKALLDSTKNPKKKQNNSKNVNEDDDLVSRPSPLFPQTPKTKIENTVSVPLSITKDSRFPLSSSPQRSSMNSLDLDELSSPVKPISKPDIIRLPIPTINSSEESPPLQIHNKLTGLESDIGSITEQSIKSTESNIPLSDPKMKNHQSSFSKGVANIWNNTNSQPSLPVFSSIGALSSSKPETEAFPITSTAASISTRKPSKIPIKLPRNDAGFTDATQFRNIPNVTPALVPDNSLKISKQVSPNQSSSKNFPFSSNNESPSGPNSLLSKTIPTLSPLSKITNVTEDSTTQLAKSNSGPSKKQLNQAVSSNTPTSISTENKIKAIQDPFQDLANIFKPPAAPRGTDDSFLSANPFASTITPSYSSKPKSFLSNPGDIFSIPLNTPPSSASFTRSQNAPSTLRSSQTKANTKSGESVAPVSKKILPGNSFEQAIEQNNKAFEKNMEDFGKSIANVFTGGANAPTPGPSTSI